MARGVLAPCCRLRVSGSASDGSLSLPQLHVVGATQDRASLLVQPLATRPVCI